MADRDLYLAASPEDAGRIVRARAVPAGGDPVVVTAELDSLAAVGVRLPEQALRPAPGAGGWVVDRDVVVGDRVGRAFQPWHVDIEPDEVVRWQGYLQPGSERVLRNLVAADSVEVLRVREDDQVAVALLELGVRPVAQSFNLAHLRAVHDRLFAEVYPWAGEPRTVDMGKGGGVPFVSWGAIETTFAYVAEQVAAHDRFRGMGREQFVSAAAWTYNAVNTIHPFREGNGRAQRVWLDDLAAGAGWQFDWPRVHGVENDATSRRAQGGDLEVMRVMLDRITGPLDPATAERRRVQQSVARLAAYRAPASGITAGGPGAYPAARPAHGPGVTPTVRDAGYER